MFIYAHVLGSFFAAASLASSSLAQTFCRRKKLHR